MEKETDNRVEKPIVQVKKEKKKSESQPKDFYICISKVKHNGVNYRVGDKFPKEGEKVTRTQVNRLLEIGCIN